MAIIPVHKWLHIEEQIVTEVGIRELRDNLSRYLKQVKEGEDVVVTDHGRAVARIIPFGAPRSLDRLIEAGIVTPAVEKKHPDLPPRIPASGPVSPLVGEQRQ